MSRRRVAVIPCSAAKLEHRAPALELYTGSLYRSALLAAAALRAYGRVDSILVLSARHGLVALDTELDPYNVKMGDPGTISTAAVADQLAAVAELGIEAGRPGLVELVPILPAAYDLVLRNAAELLWPPLVDVATNPLTGSRGILEQRRRLRELREQVEELTRIRSRRQLEGSAVL